jgi:hypothetical protein
MLIKAASLVLVGTTGLLLDIPLVTSESVSLVVWGVSLLAISASLRYVTSPRQVAGQTVRLSHRQPASVLSLVRNVRATRQEVTL